MVRKDLGWTDIDIEIYVGTWNTPSELNSMYYNASNSNASLNCSCRSFWGCPGFHFVKHILAIHPLMEVVVLLEPLIV